MSVLDFGRPVGAAHPPFIIAALDGRELNTLDRALEAVEAAAASRCDAVRVSRMPMAWSARMFERAAERGIVMLATALDEGMVARLDWLGAPAFYLVFDWSDLELVACAARTGKPLVLQVGTASEVELAEVIATAHANGSGGIALVQSVIDVELEGLEALGRHGAVLGIADRSLGSEIPLAAISRGAAIVEKRFNALSPPEICAVVNDCEQAWAMLGSDGAWVFN